MSQERIAEVTPSPSGSAPQTHSAPAKIPLHKNFASAIAVITSSATLDGVSHANAMACEWTMNVSYSPFLVLAMIENADYSKRLIQESGEFGVNICSDQQAGVVNAVGRTTGWETSKLDLPQLVGQTYQAKKIKAPMIRGAVLNLECVVESTISIGEYTGFIGRAVSGRAKTDATPLIYFQGKYFRMGDLIEKPGDPS